MNCFSPSQSAKNPQNRLESSNRPPILYCSSNLCYLTSFSNFQLEFSRVKIFLNPPPRKTPILIYGFTKLQQNPISMANLYTLQLKLARICQNPFFQDQIQNFDSKSQKPTCAFASPSFFLPKKLVLLLKKLLQACSFKLQTLGQISQREEKKWVDRGREIFSLGRGEIAVKGARVPFHIVLQQLQLKFSNCHNS